MDDDTQERIGSVRTAALRRACDILGGPSQLRRYLGVSAIALGVWISGSEPPPVDAFLKAVDVIADHNIEEFRRKAAGAKR